MSVKEIVTYLLFFSGDSLENENRLDPSNDGQCTVEIQNLKKTLTAENKYLAKLESCISKGSKGGPGEYHNYLLIK